MTPWFFLNPARLKYPYPENVAQHYFSTCLEDGPSYYGIYADKFSSNYKWLPTFAQRGEFIGYTKYERNI